MIFIVETDPSACDVRRISDGSTRKWESQGIGSATMLEWILSGLRGFAWPTWYVPQRVSTGGNRGGGPVKLGHSVRTASSSLKRAGETQQPFEQTVLCASYHRTPAAS